MSEVSNEFAALWRSLAPIGRDEQTGGYLRYAWSDADLACRAWFVEQAAARGLTVETDGNGNLWAWWGDPSGGSVVATGSHLDSVPYGGGYDGPLGIVSALLAVDLLRQRGITPSRPIAVVAFAEEEGSRFGVACLGSRLLVGAIDPDQARRLQDRDGVSLAGAMSRAGVDPDGLGALPDRLARLAAFVELHIEQGRALIDLDAPVGVASQVWPHGRWRMAFTGEANHAGTTDMSDRRDPMLTFAYTVLAANKSARLLGARATVGRVEVEPNATNAIPTRVTGWLDARAAETSILDELVDRVTTQAGDRAMRDATAFSIIAESLSAATAFDTSLRDRLAILLGGPGGLGGAAGPVPILPTGAGHDAAVLAAAGVPTAMLFVRNPTGVSHAPAETASDTDCAAGVIALADVLEELACP